MMITTTIKLGRELQINGRLTIHKFCESAKDIAERRCPAGQLPAELQRWRNSGYDPAELQRKVQKSLENLLHELAQWQIRFDGDYENLQRTRQLIENGTAKQHADDTILARALVDWCKAFSEIAEKA